MNQEFQQSVKDVKALVGQGRELQESVQKVINNRGLNAKEARNLYQLGKTTFNTGKKLYNTGKRNFNRYKHLLPFPVNAGSGPARQVVGKGDYMQQAPYSQKRGGGRRRPRKRYDRRPMVLGASTKSTIASTMNDVMRGKTFKKGFKKAKPFGRTNRYLRNSQGNRRFNERRTVSGTTITNLENIITMVGDGQSVDKMFSYPINPGLSELFPWLAQIANNYIYYRFQDLTFTLEAQVGSNDGGTWAIGYDYDANFDINNVPDFNALTTLGYGETCDIKKTLVMNWRRVNLKGTTAQLKVRAGNLSSSSPNAQQTTQDLTSFDCGHVYFGFNTGVSSALGRVIVSYTVEFFNTNPNPASLTSYMRTDGVIDYANTFASIVEFSLYPPYTVIQNAPSSNLTRLYFAGPYKALMVVYLYGSGFVVPDEGSLGPDDVVLVPQNAVPTTVVYGLGVGSTTIQLYEYSLEMVAGSYFDMDFNDGKYATVTFFQIQMAPYNLNAESGAILTVRPPNPTPSIHAANFQRSKSTVKTIVSRPMVTTVKTSNVKVEECKYGSELGEIDKNPVMDSLDEEDECSFEDLASDDPSTRKRAAAKLSQLWKEKPNTGRGSLPGRNCDDNAIFRLIGFLCLISTCFCDGPIVPPTTTTVAPTKMPTTMRPTTAHPTTVHPTHLPTHLPTTRTPTTHPTINIHASNSDFLIILGNSTCLIKELYHGVVNGLVSRVNCSSIVFNHYGKWTGLILAILSTNDGLGNVIANSPCVHYSGGPIPHTQASIVGCAHNVCHQETMFYNVTHNSKLKLGVTSLNTFTTTHYPILYLYFVPLDIDWQLWAVNYTILSPNSQNAYGTCSGGVGNCGGGAFVTN
jgi:hypothetical protein